NLLFMSAEATNSRADCGFGGVPDPVSKDRVRGIRIFDISDVKTPKLVTSVQTCRGSHTHTVVTQPGDNDNVYIYVSGTAGVRSADELPGCQDGGLDDPNTARFRLEVIKVPLAAPQQAAIVSSPRIFNALPVPPRNPERDAVSGRGGPGGVPPRAPAGAQGGPPGAGSGQPGAGSGRGGAGRQGEAGSRVLAAGSRELEAGSRELEPGSRQLEAASRERLRPTDADAAIRDRRPDRTSVTTSRCIPRSGSPAALARDSGCCSTSATPGTRTAPTSSPTRTCRSGTLRPSA